MIEFTPKRSFVLLSFAGPLQDWCWTTWVDHGKREKAPYAFQKSAIIFVQFGFEPRNMTSVRVIPLPGPSAYCSSVSFIWRLTIRSYISEVLFYKLHDYLVITVVINFSPQSFGTKLVQLRFYKFRPDKWHEIK